MQIPDLLRPAPKYPVYPPYHEGLYLEDYFYEWSKGKKFNREYLPIFWTSLYCNNEPINIQNILDRFPRDGKYFTVCQHDDAPLQRLPPDTKVFSSGAHRNDPTLIPLPYICSLIKSPDLYKQRNIFCSFVGSVTNNIRTSMIEKLKNNSKYYIQHQNWTPSVPIENFKKFKDVTERSVFALCPRGYGKSSFRLYECMQLGSVPVYISDVHYLPWSDELDWSKLAILLSEKDIDNIDQILSSIPEGHINTIKNYTKKVYNEYFTLEAVCKQIEKRL